MAEEAEEDGPSQPSRLVLPAKGRVQFSGEEERATLRESTRSWIAKVLVGLLCILFLVAVGLVAGGKMKVNDAISIMAPLTALVGTVLGFYFGGQKGGT